LTPNLIYLITISLFLLQNQGSLPIENVTVTWQVLLDDELECVGCSGEVVTDKGGVFELKIKASHPSLDNNRDFPVKLVYSKTSPSSPPIVHEFLCKNGVEACDTTNGDIIYLRHLHFEKPHHIYDDTLIFFTGKITIADTEGCPLLGVQVCVYHYGTMQREKIVCGSSDSNGLYLLPVVEGSIIHEVEVTYYEHEFKSRSGIDYESGLHILASEAPFFGNDFEDVSKAELRVEIAGGFCDYPLGKSSVLIKVMNCGWEPEPFTQSGKYLVENLHTNILSLSINLT